MSPQIKTRKPTGAVPWPLVLIEGGEKAGKSWKLAEFSADPRLGQVYWLDLGEGAADEYAAIEGANYEVIEHDGTYATILEQVQAVHAEAARANRAGEPPVVLFIDSMTNMWDQLKDWTTQRARESRRGRRELAADPNAEIKPPPNLWNDANARHYRIMNLLMQFPGIVVMTARGKEVSVTGADGNPIAGQRDWKVEGHKNLAFDSSVWVRLSREDVPQIIGARSVHVGIVPGVEKARKAPGFTLAWLIFDVLKCDPKTARVRDLRVLDTAAEQVADVDAANQGSYAEEIGVIRAEMDRRADEMLARQSTADRARDAVDRQTSTGGAELEDALLAELETATTREALGAIWKAAGGLDEDRCKNFRALVEDRVRQLASNAA